MGHIHKLINKANWRYHMNGGYYERELLDGGDLDKANAELSALEARLKEAEAIIRYNEWNGEVDGFSACPECDCTRPRHTSDCRLNAFLKGAA